MQYLLIPKLNTHWTGFQTNAALSHSTGERGGRVGERLENNTSSLLRAQVGVNKPRRLPAALTALTA